MKTLFLSIAAISLFACNSSDDDNNETVEASIVGKWQPAKYAAYSGKDGSIIADKTSDATVCDKKGLIDISANGKLHAITYYGNAESECKIDSDTTSDYTYDASAKKIQVKNSDGTTEVSTIKKLTVTELEVVQELSDVNGDGIKDEITAVFKRL